MMNAFSNISGWYSGLESRERVMVSVTAVVVIVTLFYLMLWEPIYKGLDEERDKNQNRQANLAWMQQAANEVRSLKSSGASTKIRNQNAPVSLSVEQSAATSGVKNNLSKLESSGKDSARVVLDGVSFNQMVLWLNTLQNAYGISASNANIERTERTGYVNARVTLARAK